MNTLWTNTEIPEDVANRVKARRHLASLSPARRDALEREWSEAEFRREPISAEIKARAEKEWES
jgi:hypothetical protein